MDTTEINFPSDQPTDLVLTTDAKYFLHTAGRWAYFLSILGFIGTGFIVLAAFFVGALMTVISRFSPNASPDATMAASGASGFITVIYLGLAVLYFFMSYYLNRFAVNIKRGVTYSSSADATIGFQNLKSHFKLIGITAIIVIALYVLIIVVVIIAAVTGALASHNVG